MDRKIISLCLSLSFMLLFAGCAGKTVSSSSGDAASRAGQTKSEEIKPDAIKTVPLERSFDRPSGSIPVNPALARSTDSDSSVLGDVFFDYDRFQIRTDAMPLLDANAGWLRANGDKTVLIEGHCDERGTVAYNLVLGEKRARATKKYLQDLGIAASQLQITSYGETKPFCKQQNEDCYQQNRRAHFVTK
jgi:peptidoglycan-associated lipoprotein